MGKIIKVKASKRKGKTVKAHTRRIPEGMKMIGGKMYRVSPRLKLNKSSPVKADYTLDKTDENILDSILHDHATFNPEINVANAKQYAVDRFRDNMGVAKLPNGAKQRIHAYVEQHYPTKHGDVNA